MLSSLRIRLTLWYAAALAVLLIGFAVVLYFLIERAVRQITDDTLEDAANSLVTILRAEKPDAGENSLSDRRIEEVLEDFRFQYIVFAVYDERFNSIAVSPRLQTAENAGRAPFNISREEIPLEKIRSAATDGAGFESISTAGSPDIRIYAERAEFKRGTLIVAAVRPLTTQLEILSTVRLLFVTGIPFAVLLSVIGGYFLARKSLKPVRQMSETAALITSRNLAERLPAGVSGDELADLADTFNEMLARLEGSFELQRRFMADASHELRTPLAIIRGESEVSLQKANRSEEDYRESLEIIRQEGARLSHIVEDLFLLARADSGSFRPAFTSFYLDELVSDCVRAFRTLAERKGLSLDVEIGEGLLFEGSEPLVRRLVMNLLDNAVKYSDEGGKVRLTCAEAGKAYEIGVENTGDPIPESDRARIFDRFHRSDKGRAYESPGEAGSGAGLGLAIGRSIARIHGGDIYLKRSDDTSTVFAATLPRPHSV